MTNPELASLEYLNLGYIVTDMEHRVLIINQAARELLVDTKVIKTLEEVVAKLPDRLVLLDHVKYCSIEHKSCSFREVELGDRIIRLFLSPIFEGSDLQGNLLTLEDITDKVEQGKARDQFLSFLVHELRTPLTAIRSNSALIEDYYPDILKDKALQEIVTDIHSGSKYVLGMVNQFLDMARLEEGRIEFDMQEFEAVSVIRETIQSLGILAKERNLSLTFEAPENQKIQVVADPNRIKQVVTNLIGNGLKFSDNGGVTVTIKLSDEQLDVSVTDTGAGIPLDSQSKMFQKFFQASNNKLRKDSAKSTGLGLYVTKLMMEGMHGQIYLARSEVNKGSTFTFTIPLATPGRLKQLAKELSEIKQGVQHAQVPEHSSVAV